MSVQANTETITYDDNFLLAEFTLGHDLAPSTTEVNSEIVLSPPKQAAFRQAAGLLAVAKQTSGEDQTDWQPNEVQAEHITTSLKPFRQYLHMVQGVETYVEDLVTGNPTDHYEHQLTAFQRIAQFLASGDPSATNSAGLSIKSPTASGKSRIIAETVWALKLAEDPEEPVRVMLVAPSNAIVAEIVGADGRSGLGKYAPQLSVGVYNQDSKQTDRPVMVTTNASLLRLIADQPELINSFNLTMLDESHDFLGEKTFAALQQLGQPLLAFSATPEYSSKKKVQNLLPEQIELGNTIDMIEQGILSPAQLWICKTDQVISYDSRREDFSPEEYQQISHFYKRRLIAEALALNFFEQGRQGVITANTIAEADTFAAELSDQQMTFDGVVRQPRVRAVHSKTKDNHASFRALSAGDIDAVVIVDVDEGWDAQAASFIINARPSRSRVKVGQRSGRALRMHRDAAGNPVVAQFIDLVDIFNPIHKPRSEDAVTPAAITVPQLFGQMTYEAGQLLSSPVHESVNRYRLDQFPAHLRNALSMGSGVNLAHIEGFGMTANRITSNSDALFTPIEAARGLAIPLTRLQTLVMSCNVKLAFNDTFDQAAIDTVAKRLEVVNEPISI